MMMSRQLSANIYSIITSATIAFQLALVAGAPWGSLTQGGRVSGVLPVAARAIAAFSAVLLLWFVVIVRANAASHGSTGARRYPRAIWGVVTYSALGIVANAATPSAAERAIWLPVVTLMFITSLRVARRARP